MSTSDDTVAKDEHYAKSFEKEYPLDDFIVARKRAVLLRLEPALITRFDRAAKRLGISRAAFIVSSAVKELERVES